MHIAPDKFHETAWSSYLPQLRELVSRYQAARILELGAGRWPSFRISDMPDTLASYTVNDISQSELDLAAPEYEKACFDVTGDVSQFAGQFDVVFSRSLAEHVKNGRALHRNVLELLRPGGVAFHMIPTLYAPAFVLNRLMPETLSRSILHFFFPRRRTDAPKFPAYYSWCYGNSAKMEKMLRSVGYGDVRIRNFYGTEYFESIPVVKQLAEAFSALAAKNDWSSVGSYAYIIAYK